MTKSFEIFCGTGGVGKTTLATSRAVALASNDLKVLLITIDPARRLKDLLGLNDSNIGDICPVEINGTKLHALLMSPEKTIQRMASTNKTPELAQNRIIKILSKPYGGMNEILSLIEVQMQFESGKYDVIVLDTPPGEHFLDFLESISKIKTFFDQSFIELFSYITQKTAKASKSLFRINFVNKILSGGLQKLLGYLQKVTDAKFIDDFIEAVKIIYESKAAFMKGISLQEKLKSRSECNWFLVTSVEQGKAEEALTMKEHAKSFMHQDHFLVLNKCLENELKEWAPIDELKSLKSSLETREVELKKSLKANFPTVLEFPEIMQLSPLEHVNMLTAKWKIYAI